MAQDVRSKVGPYFIAGIFKGLLGRKYPQPYDLAKKFDADLKFHGPVDPGGTVPGGLLAEFFLKKGADWINAMQKPWKTIDPCLIPWHHCVCDKDDNPLTK